MCGKYASPNTEILSIILRTQVTQVQDLTILSGEGCKSSMEPPDVLGMRKVRDPGDKETSCNICYEEEIEMRGDRDERN